MSLTPEYPAGRQADGIVSNNTSVIHAGSGNFILLHPEDSLTFKRA